MNYFQCKKWFLYKYFFTSLNIWTFLNHLLDMQNGKDIYKTLGEFV